MSNAPGLNHWLPFPYGSLGESLRDQLGFQLRGRERFGDVFRYRVGPMLLHFLFHPDHVRRVLHDQQKNYLRGWQYRLLGRLLGNGLVVTEGEFWLRQRRLAQPAFHHARLAGYVATMADATSTMLGRWEQEAAAERPVDVAAEMGRLTMAIAARTLFSRDVSDEADAVGRAIGVLLRYLEHRLNHPLTSLPVWMPTARNRRFRRAVRSLNLMTQAIVDERRRDTRDQGDLLSMLMAARDDESGEGMTDRQLRAEVLTFFVAGQETTAVALAWTFYLVASRPAVRERLREEIGRIVGDRQPTIDDLAHLEYARMVIEEAMRLYPPVYTVVRSAVHEDEIGGYRIPARSAVVLSQFVTHRHPDFWERPDEFDPERFSAERAAARPKYTYFPFIGGPHQCIGNEFAMLEARLVLTMALRKFDCELLPGQAIEPMALLTLRPSGPVRVTLKSMAADIP